ncbi:MAG: hypothetical protein K8I03_10710 [Ignavibacteria bacterium]|nr:hypothetical protein [Ignavibacteria bacterium]
MKAGYLQFKPEFCSTDANIKKIQRLIEGKEFDLLVLPELANSGYLFSDFEELNKASEEIPNGKFCNALRELSKHHSGYIVSGICEKAGGIFFNSSVLVSPEGTIYSYRKIHLFADEKKWFSPGDTGFNVYEIAVKDTHVKVGMMICFDWLYPESARSLALKGAQIICHPSNLVMPYCQRAMFTRALENHVFTITANRTGKEARGGDELEFTGGSVMVDPKGNYLLEGSLDKDECEIADIDPAEALNKDITPNNEIFQDRRTDMYSL